MGKFKMSWKTILKVDANDATVTGWTKRLSKLIDEFGFTKGLSRMGILDDSNFQVTLDTLTEIIHRRNDNWTDGKGKYGSSTPNSLDLLQNTIQLASIS